MIGLAHPLAMVLHRGSEWVNRGASDRAAPKRRKDELGEGMNSTKSGKEPRHSRAGPTLVRIPEGGREHAQHWPRFHPPPCTPLRRETNRLG